MRSPASHATAVGMPKPCAWRSIAKREASSRRSKARANVPEHLGGGGGNHVTWAATGRAHGTPQSAV